jgi:hemerythrin-like domain-containing protein
MIERLRAEHRDFRLELIQIEEVSKFSSHKAIEILREIGKSILRHEVEEEAGIIRFIMENVKESEQSVKVMQEHKGIIDVLEKKISQLEGSSQEATEEIKTFGDDIRRHFLEEEEIVFPLVLKAVSA